MKSKMFSLNFKLHNVVFTLKLIEFKIPQLRSLHTLIMLQNSEKKTQLRTMSRGELSGDTSDVELWNWKLAFCFQPESTKGILHESIVNILT